jgi:hypothetical protein
MFKVGFLVSLYNHEQTRPSLKLFTLSLFLKKTTQVCLPVLEKLVLIRKLISDHNEGYQAKKNKGWKISSVLKTEIFSITPLF